MIEIKEIFLKVYWQKKLLKIKNIKIYYIISKNKFI